MEAPKYVGLLRGVDDSTFNPYKPDEIDPPGGGTAFTIPLVGQVIARGSDLSFHIQPGVTVAVKSGPLEGSAKLESVFLPTAEPRLVNYALPQRHALQITGVRAQGVVALFQISSEPVSS